MKKRFIPASLSLVAAVTIIMPKKAHPEFKDQTILKNNPSSKMA
jgi:hypothetical protein